MPRELHVTTPMMSGQDVLDVQQRLIALGYAPGIADGVYGATTASAIGAFQAAQGLTVDGIVGPQTQAALTSAGGVAQPTSSTKGLAALAEAGKWLGTKESPAETNCTPFGKWFGVDGVAWCNIFVSYCFATGASYIIASGFSGGKGAGIYPGKGCSYVPTTEAWLRATGMWVGRTTPLPGDIAVYNLRGREPDHIGIVAKDLGNGAFEAIEGNTAIGSDSDGGEVMRRTRYLVQVDGFGRVQ